MADSVIHNDDPTLYGAQSTPRNFDEGLEVSGVKITEEILNKYEKEICASRPDIKQVIEKNGAQTFFDFTKAHIRENRNSVIKSRKQELHSVLSAHITPLLGTKIAASVIKQLKGNDSVSTIQHGVPLGHPYILSAVFQNALPYFGASNPNLQNVIVMSNSLASFNNYSFPKADALHVLGNNSLEVPQFNLFGQSHEAFSTIFHEPYGEVALSELEKRAVQLRQNGKLQKEHMQKIMDLLNNVYASPHVLAQKDYTDQLTVLNFHMWKELMKGYKKSVPNLIFLSQELITLALLKKYHMNTESILSKLLFDNSCSELFIKHFDGLNGAFNTAKQTGTFLFWAHSKQTGHREQLVLQDGMLKSTASSYGVLLSPEAITRAIEQNELIPSTSLVFIVLAFYYGLFLGGGIAQAANLDALQKAYVALLKDMSCEEDMQALEGLITANTIISRPTFLYLENNNLRIPATGLDIAVYSNGKSNWESVIESTRHVAFSEVLKRIYPFYYSQFVQEKDEELSKITEKDMEESVGLEQKIPPLFTV